MSTTAVDADYLPWVAPARRVCTLGKCRAGIKERMGRGGLGMEGAGAVRVGIACGVFGNCGAKGRRCRDNPASPAADVACMTWTYFPSNRREV